MRQILKNAGAMLLASTIALGLSGMSHASGASDQGGEHGSRAGQGGSVSKQDRSATGKTNQPGTVKPKDAQREKLEERVNKEKEQDRQHTLDPSQHTPSK